MTLSVRGVTVAYGDRAVVRDLDLHAEPGEIVALLGPSGCGKTTLLRAIAGLEPTRSGSVWIGGRDHTHTPVHRRGAGLMFQDYALFPHRNAGDNVAFGLRMQGRDRDEVDQRVREVLDLVGLTGEGHRSVTTMSGGEQQRVALARAIAPEPAVLLLDEPLGSLDRDLRSRLVGELAEIFTAVHAAVVYVTHDQDEAFALGDRVVVMRDGEVEREGTSESVWRDPSTAFVAAFLGLGTLIATTADGSSASTPWGTSIPTVLSGPVSLVVRPSAVTITAVATLTGVVRERRFVGGVFRVVVETPIATLALETAGDPPPVRAVVGLSIDDRGVDVVRSHPA